MVELAKLIHDAIGIESPRTFIAVFAISGALIFGVLGWLVDHGYRVKIREEQANAAAKSEPQPSIHIEQHGAGPNSPSINTFGPNSPVIINPNKDDARTPRMLTDAQEQVFIETLRVASGAHVRITTTGNTPETQ